MSGVLPRSLRTVVRFEVRYAHVAITAAALLLAGSMTARSADGDRLTVDGNSRFANASYSDALAGPERGARQFHFSGLSVAPAPRSGVSEWYNRFEQRAAHPQTIAAFVKREPTTQLASADPENGKAERLLSGDAKPVMASLGPSATDARPIQVLAYADPSPKAEGGALAALDSAAGIQLDAGEAIESEDALLVPENVPLPVPRPEPPEAAKPATKQDAKKQAEKPDAVEQDEKAETPPRAAALSRPNIQGEQDDSSPGFIKKFFSPRPRAGSGVAVYDISAAKVYMPDGSVLEAASGIGKMANNPKYAHVKMNGPTPPHTYNLKMREKRFHGVEAIRMLPVDGKNKYGRDGFLTHSQLLRGRPGQSHGCVAFKDYNKFLNAFKRGKVKQMIVVSGGGARVFARASSKGGDV